MKILETVKTEMSFTQVQEITTRKEPVIGEIFTPDKESEHMWCIIAVAEHYADPSLKVVVYFDLNADEEHMDVAHYAMLGDFVKRNFWVASNWS